MNCCLIVLGTVVNEIQLNNCLLLLTVTRWRRCELTEYLLVLPVFAVSN